MNTEYVAIKRRPNHKNRTRLPKPYMMSKVVIFLVKKKFAKNFPKGISWEGLHKADFIFADGVLIKNVAGPAASWSSL